MDTMKLITGLVLLAAVAPTAVFADSVIVQGTRYTCSNTCNVSFGSDGTYTVSDCCGGRVRFQIQ